MSKTLENLENFQILRVIGSGSYGTVFESIDCTTNNRMALKICFLENNELSIDLERELLILSLLDSPFFPKFYGYKKVGSFLIIGLEVCSGVPLNEFLKINTIEKSDKCKLSSSNKNHLLEESLVISLINQILDAVLYLHSHNIVHRDIKLENIILSETKLIKICDFGFARFFDRNESLKEFSGSHQYASPEVFSNTPYNGPKNDIWTIGICLLKMLVGDEIFDEISDGKSISTLYSIFEKDIPSYKFKILLKAILQINPMKRPTLENIYKQLNLKMPEFKTARFIFLDIVTLHLMKQLGFSTEHIHFDNKQKGDEIKIYRLIFEKVYFSKRVNQYTLTEDQMLEIYKNSIKTKNSVLCCMPVEYILLKFHSFYEFESLAKPSNILYSIVFKNKWHSRIKFYNQSLVIDYLIIKKSENYEVKIVKIFGETNNFASVLQKIITSFNKSL